jgi:transcriptional regulator with XRE-family HTH domain
MSNFLHQGSRLREERERLRLSQTDFAKIGGAGRKSQFNYETGDSAPDGAYLSAIAAIGVDVLYVLTGQRAESTGQPQGVAADSARGIKTMTLKPDEAALIDNYRNSPAVGQEAVRKTALALAQQKIKGRAA